MSKKTEYEHKWHNSLRGKKWQVGRQWDRGCGCFESSGFQPFSVCGHPKTEVEHCADKLQITGWLFLAVFVTPSHNHLRVPLAHEPQAENHCFINRGTVKKKQLQGKEGRRYRRDTHCQAGGTELCHFCVLDLQISSSCI